MYRPFAERLSTPLVWTRIAFGAHRWTIAFALCAFSALLMLGLAYMWPEASDPDRVRQTFARYISGLMTVATIAVGFGALALQRGIKGLGELRTHVQADRDYAERVRELTGERPPITVGGTLALLLDSVAARARELAEDALAEHATESARRVREAKGDPTRLLAAALDFDSETAVHDARTRIRDERLDALLETADVGRSYVKTLATQWGLSRMSQAIALGAMLAVVATTVVVLTYERGPLAPFVLAGTTFVALVPLAIFVSYALRFTFVNRHTLPIGHFVLGPENADAEERPRLARGNRRAS